MEPKTPRVMQRPKMLMSSHDSVRTLFLEAASCVTRKTMACGVTEGMCPSSGSTIKDVWREVCSPYYLRIDSLMCGALLTPPIPTARRILDGGTRRNHTDEV